MSDIAIRPESLALVPANQQEAAVSVYLEQARDRLAIALEATGPEAVASIKAEIATAAEATKQLGLSKEIRDDATEMVRRAEYALGKAVRKGQAEGVVGSREHMGSGATRPYERVRHGVRETVQVPARDESDKLIPAGSFFSSGDDLVKTYAVVDGVTDDQFEEALTEARDEGNLSRANVVRKIKKQDGTQSRQQRADLIRELADTGMASSQMVAKVGVSEQSVRQIARDFSIEIPADRVVGRTRRIDPIRVARETVMAADGLASTVDLVHDLTGLDPSEAAQWTASLDQSIRALNRLNKKIKEAVL